jgi:hypothetical protein
MAKARTTPSTKAAKKRGGCARNLISFTTKRGKRVEFPGHAGKTCGPRPKPKTGHLRHFKTEFGRAARHCKGRSRGAFLNCMSTQMPK